MDDLIARLKAANADVERRDDSLRQELQERRESLSFTRESLRESREDELVFEGQRVDRHEFELETIVLRTGRPVLAIVRDVAQLIFTDPESKVWKQRLQQASANLVKAAKAIGRIEIEGHAFAWLGTGWLVSPDVIVTNRHVAAEFGRQSGTSFVFRQGLTGTAMTASIDFLEEVGRQESLVFRVERILHIEGPDGPDLAFLRVKPVAGQSLAAPIGLATAAANRNDMVAVIGYPARDSRIPDQALMEKIFGHVYDKKRLAPGQLTKVESESVRHDCSTLGGNSGSVVLSLGSGQAVGLHFAGRFLQANFAVPGAVIAERLDQVTSGRIPPRPRAPEGRPQPATRSEPAAAQALSRPTARAKVSYVLPLRVTLEIFDPYPASAPSVASTPAPQPGTATDEDEVFTEAVPEDYRDRQGYREDFLGDGAAVPLPAVQQGEGDVLTFTSDGNPEQVLQYEHFSVLMSKQRRLCFYSAVNIDGKQPKSFPRGGWRTDPRIPLAAQIKGECYGNSPRFSRGHMTRREDPVWGENASASKGNADSMHVTNVVPQMQPFNAGIWLELENYALQHARQDDMKISVFTGPFLLLDDPVMFDIRIPVEFWKVIAFIHDETGELCATGYTMSQRDFFSEDEFVFGKHKTAQRSLASIEARTGLSFGRLTELDPFEDEEGLPSELTDLRQIRFIKRR
jgi:endonuclease G, mitochondrial